ncbi:MAG: CidA/LrgA family protein [Lachnospiraceae bacterium]|nr:CidA/LrgA family protein [Lachnospiraceae bacterium]
MKYVKQFMIIIIFSFLGELLHGFLPFPVPASIYGLILLFLALFMGIIKEEQIKETADFLVEIMPVLFIPAGVGLMTRWEALKKLWLPFVLIITLGTVFTMVVTGKVTDGILKRKGVQNK